MIHELVRRRFLASAAACGLLATGTLPAFAAEGEGTMFVYVGTYTAANGSKGIYLYELDPVAGTLTPHGLACEAVNPSFLALHPTKPLLYAVSETSTTDGKKAGAVSAFGIDAKTGKLQHLNKQLSGGQGPCHLTVDHSGKTVLVANYGSGTCGALPIEEDGRLGEMKNPIQHKGSGANAGRQKEPHAHSINVDPGNRYAFCADLGCDKVFVYKLDSAAAELTPNDPPAAETAPGAGPRHFAFAPGGKHAYVINELNSTITAFSYDAEHGKLTTVHSISTLPEGYQGYNSTAEVQVHPSGKFVYGSNRGHNSIAVFARDAETGKLTYVENQGFEINVPRNFGIDPTGRILIVGSQQDDKLTVFRIDATTGKLTPIGNPIPQPKPVCIKFLPKG